MTSVKATAVCGAVRSRIEAFESETVTSCNINFIHAIYMYMKIGHKYSAMSSELLPYHPVLYTVFSTAPLLCMHTENIGEFIIGCIIQISEY